MADEFKLVSDFEPKGDQPEAVRRLVAGLEAGEREQVLLGVTGSGKTYSIALVIEALNRPALVFAHNKTLAAQLYQEFKSFFPHNAVEYFVSYYDYYQPEAYIPTTDTYIEKETQINEEIDRMRLSATRSLFERRDVIIVASVSCIYGIGAPEEYFAQTLIVEQGERISREKLLRQLVDIQYSRNDLDFRRGTFRVRGDVVEVYPSYEEMGVRIELFGDEVDKISIIDPLRGTVLREKRFIRIFAKSHYVTTRRNIVRAVETIGEELGPRLVQLRAEEKLLEAQRLEQRTRYDMEMLREMNFCQGIENYSRHLSGRAQGEPPDTLFSYLPDNALLIVDESHVSLPQVRGMHGGDRSRKSNLVHYGFRLPSALDNRPLSFEEFVARQPQTIYVSATPAAYELERVGGVVVEQIIRPTGLMDPEIDVRSARGQVDDLYGEIVKRVGKGHRVLVTTLTKRMAEDLTDYFEELGVRVRYLHADVETLERVKLLRELRQGEYDVLVGINLLREGLDLPEVSLVAVLDADKEGFLRSTGSLIQIAGRAARNVEGLVIFYADRVTDSMRRAMDETLRRRQRQMEYNKVHGITPQSIVKSIDTVLGSVYEADYTTVPKVSDRGKATVGGDLLPEYLDEKSRQELTEQLEREMMQAAADLQFEKAAEIRDRIKALQESALFT